MTHRDAFLKDAVCTSLVHAHWQWRGLDLVRVADMGLNLNLGPFAYKAYIILLSQWQEKNGIWQVVIAYDGEEF